MLNKFKIEEVEKISEEQENLNKKFHSKLNMKIIIYRQIYYSENTDQYFMLVPTEDSDYSTFFYLLKTNRKEKSTKDFVPIRM